MKLIIACLFFIVVLPMAGQVSSYDELTMESDSIKTTYKPTKKNFALVRSKRGTSGLNKTPRADSILALPVTEIILVFSELDASAIADRDEANRERWDNLIMTYPEFFQTNTTYKTICQCNNNGDAEAFKQMQGFYIYFVGEEPKAAAAPPPPSTPKATEKAPEKAPEKTAVAVADKTAAKAKDAPPVEKEVAKQPETPAPPVAATPPANTSTVNDEDAPVKESGKKRAPAVKARRAKDPKACRPPCYQGGDEDLNAYLKSSIALTKKQKRHGKKLMATVKIQLGNDGIIKTCLVTGTDEPFNKQVQDALNAMGQWNSAVKNGVSIKSEVKFMLKYNKETKSMQPYEMMLNPRPAPKCKCASDSEIFGSE